MHGESSTPSTADLGSPQELELKLKLVPAGDTARGYFFHCALEQLRFHGRQEALRRWREAGGLEATMPFFKYPISELLRLLYHAAWELEGASGSFEAALRQLGRGVALEFLGNPVGRTMLLVAGRNLKLLVDNLPTAYRTGWEHGKGKVVWLGPTRCLVSIHGNVIPYPYFEGVFLEVFQAARAAHFAVKGRQLGPSDTEYEMSWD